MSASQMSALWWSRIHTAVTHFLIALVFCAAWFDLIGLVLYRRPARGNCLPIGYWLVLLGGITSFIAVASGLASTECRPFAMPGLRQHHLFVWPAFCLILVLATWRLMAGKIPRVRGLIAYEAVLLLSCLVVAGAWWTGIGVLDE